MNDEMLSTVHVAGVTGSCCSRWFCSCIMSTKPPQWSVVCRRAGQQLPPHFARDYGEMISRRDACQNNMTYWLRKSTARGQYGARRMTIGGRSWSGVASHLHSAQVGRQYITIELDAGPHRPPWTTWHTIRPIMAGRGTSLHSTHTSSRLPIIQHAVLFASVIFHPSARTSQDHVFRLLHRLHMKY